MRQALWFGVLSTLIGLAAFVWPLVASILVGNIGATISIYALAATLDLVLFVIWVVLAMRYSQRASRGELFDVPWVARITNRWSTPT
ncbi:MAG: hypothetical protein KGN02_09425 [bacterium]|nr:hypothetical protein [bacterium]